VLHGGRSKTLARVAAHEIEQAVVDALQRLLPDESNFTDHLLDPSPQAVTKLRSALQRERQRLDDANERRKRLKALLKRVEITESTLRVTVNLSTIFEQPSDATSHPTFELPIRIARCQNGKKVVLAGKAQTKEPDPKLVAALVQAHQWHRALSDPDTLSFKDLGQQIGVEHNYLRRIHQLVFLAPDIQLAILEGRQPPELTLDRLTKHGCIPPAFEAQRRLLVCETGSVE